MDSHDIILYDPKTLEGMAELGNYILYFIKSLCCGKNQSSKN